MKRKQTNRMTKQIKNLFYFSLAISFAILPKSLHAGNSTQPSSLKLEESQNQTKKITGIVKDAAGDAIIGASVSVKGTTTGVITDIDGKYELNASEGATIEVKYLGHHSVNFKISGENNYPVTLKEDSKNLDEVVVVGYGVQKKRDLTGAISSVKMSDSPVGTFSTASQALSGKAAGLQVTQSSAQVGGGSTFRIRGTTSINAGNDPLFIVDGFPVTSSGKLESNNRYDAGTTDNFLESINPQDIESIEILKDASSTAIYGSRAGHGVVIITTKRGKKGAPKITYSGNTTFQKMKNGYKMLNGKEYMEVRNSSEYEKWLKTNGQDIYADYITPKPNPTPFKPRYSQEDIAKATTTDWFDEVTRPGFLQSHNLSMMGGSESMQYLASANYFTQQGVVKNNNMDRMTVKLNLDQQVSKYVKTGMSFHISRNKYDNVPLGKAEWENSGVITSAVRFDPTVPVRDSDGQYSKFPDLAQVPNPVSLLDMKDITQKDRLLMSSYIQAEPIKGLLFKSTFGFDRRNDKRKNYIPNTTLYGAAEGGKAFITERNNNDYLFDITGTYTKEISDHTLSAMLGYSFQQFNDEGVSAGNNDFPTDGFSFNNLNAGSGAKPYVGSWANKRALGSYFGRINYSYLGKYLLTGTFRSDGDSNFHPDHRWGYFPSISLGWRFIDESFMKSFTSIMSNGKFRVGYGETGNSNVGNRIFDTYAVLTNGVFGDTGYNGIGLQQTGNKTLTWETTSELNIGLDLGFFNNRISLAMEYYDRIISDLLVTKKKIPSYYEIYEIAANIGKTQGTGFELTLNTVNITNKDLTWSSDFTFYTFEDKWKERDPNWTPAAYESVNDPIRAHHKYLSEGLLQPGDKVPEWQKGLVPGQVKFKNLKDIEGSSNKLDQYDKVLLGDQDPNYTIGINNNVRYKAFDFNIYFYGEFGKLRSASYYDTWTPASTGNAVNHSRNALNSWAHDNRNTSVPGFIQSEYAASDSDYFIKKINYLRCRNITLGYTVPVPKKMLKSVRVYANVSNPFVFTNWTGVDPETDTENYSYPNVVGMSLGVDITF